MRVSLSAAFALLVGACATTPPAPVRPLVLLAYDEDAMATAFVVARSAEAAQVGQRAILLAHAQNAAAQGKWGFRLAREWRIEPLADALELIDDPGALEEFQTRTGGGWAFFIDAEYLDEEVAGEEGYVYSAAELMESMSPSDVIAEPSEEP